MKEEGRGGVKEEGWGRCEGGGVGGGVKEDGRGG